MKFEKHWSDELQTEVLVPVEENEFSIKESDFYDEEEDK